MRGRRGRALITLTMVGALAACGAKTGLREPPSNELDSTSRRDGSVLDASSRDGSVDMDGSIEDASIEDGSIEDGDVPFDVSRIDGDVGWLDVPLSVRDGGMSLVDAPGICLLPLEPGALNPDVHFILDRSGSMRRPFGALTRWRALVNSLIDPRTGVIPPREREVRFGTSIYPTCDRCELIIPPDFGNGERIRVDLDRNMPEGFSGTAIALRDAAMRLDTGGRRLVFVSVTDGEPTCGGSPAFCRSEVLRVVELLYEDRGIRTVPVGMGDPTAFAHFQDVADVGSGRPLGSGSRFVRGNDAAQFGAAMDELLDGLSICTAFIPEQLEGVSCPRIFVDGVPAPCNSPEGYRVLDDAYEFFGPACARIRSHPESVRIEAVVPCE